jgi:serine/threonine protein kinase
MTRKLGSYIIGANLGKGGFSKVKLGTHEETGERVALKLLPVEMDSSTRKQVTQEITAMSKVQHPNVIRLHNVDWDIPYPRKNGKTKTVILTVLELATGGELFDFLSFTGSFEEALARTYFHQLINGIGYCHEQGIVHRDLKPENLLLDANFTLKLADFGFAACKEEGKNMRTECGTPGYMGPEMINNSKGYDPVLSDIWACGVIIFIMLSGFPPFQKTDSSDWWFDKLSRGKHALFWKAHMRTVYFSPIVQDLINKMLEPNPKKRITIAEIRKHEWFNGPVISASTLQKEVARRKQVIDNEKMKERMAKAAQHNEQKGNLMGVTVRAVGEESLDPQSDDLPPAMECYAAAKLEDPSAGSMGMGGLSLGGGGAFGTGFGETIEGKAETLDSYIADTTLTRFTSDAEAAELYSHLKAVLGTIDGAEVNAKDEVFKVKATVAISTGKLGIIAQVFADEKDDKIRHVVFRREGGNGVAFRGLYLAICEKFEDFIIKPEKEEESKQ